MKRHKLTARAFSRQRKLGFDKLLVLILRKTLKSLQCHLNEFVSKYNLPIVTASAFSQARGNLKHSAFIEMNDTLVQNFYADGDYKKYRGYRVLAVDGSTVRLPYSDELKLHFGTVKEKNSYQVGERVEAKASVMYDVLNEIPIDAALERGHPNDCKMIEHHYPKIQQGDLVVLDRAYASGWLMSRILRSGGNFLIRCPSKRFIHAQAKLECNGRSSVVTKIPVKHESRVIEEIEVRFIKVKLSSGETEILITSLIDETCYQNKELQELYRLRWGVETFYDLLKSRLCVENFTGTRVEVINQDFFSTIFICSLESVCTADVNIELEEKTREAKYRRKVNKKISFNTLKNQIFELLYGENPDKLEMRLTELFLTSTTPYRPRKRSPDFKINKWDRNENHLRYRKKVVF